MGLNTPDHQCAEDRRARVCCYEHATDTERMTQMIVCSECGNKRCPKATDHNYNCTDSNEVGQPGSRYSDEKGQFAMTNYICKLNFWKTIIPRIFGKRVVGPSWSFGYVGYSYKGVIYVTKWTELPPASSARKQAAKNTVVKEQT